MAVAALTAAMAVATQVRAQPQPANGAGSAGSTAASASAPATAAPASTAAPAPASGPSAASSPPPAPAPAAAVDSAAPPLVLAPPTPAAPAPGQRADGAVLEVAVQEALTAVASSSTSAVLLGEPVGKIFVGGKIGRTVFGVGLELQRYSIGSSSSNSSTSQAQTTLLVSAGLRYALARSADERVELVGLVSFGVGHTFTDRSVSTGTVPDDPSSNHRLTYEIGPGLRYWVHPQLALGATASLRGDFYFFDSGGANSSSQSQGVTSVSTGLNLLGVF